MNPLDALGDQLRFHVRAVGAVPGALRRHGGEVRAHLTALLPAGLVVVAATAVGTALLAAVHAPGALTGFLTGYVGTREVAPLVAAFALSATIGCRHTGELAAARAGREDDALEALGLPALPFLVAPRLLAGLAAIVPLYVVGLLAGYATSRLVATGALGAATTSHDAYVALFLAPQDLGWSVAKMALLGVLVVGVHCYHGHAADGPADVGPAVARAVRTAAVVIVVADAAFGLAVWADAPTTWLVG
jgi:phospholipid/cholesterol/gamma-HCH transport system permease protein